MYPEILIMCLSMQLVLNQKLVCNNSTLRKMDTNVANIMTVGNSGRSFPSNRQQLKNYCNENYKMIVEIENYKNQCMKNLPKQATSVIIYTIKAMINSLCKKDSKRLRKLLDVSSCGNIASNEFNKCNVKFIDILLGIQNAEEKLRLPLVCCQYYELFNCITESGSKFAECSGNRMETINDFIKQIFQGSVDLICSDWTEGSDKCSKLSAPPKKRLNQRRTKSFMIPLLDLLNSLPEV